MARGRRLPVARAAARQMIWISMGVGLTTIAATTGTLLSSLNAAALALRPFTIVRTRLGLWIASDQVGATEHVAGALGMQVVTDTAVAAGAASVPTPLTDPNDDYFVYQPFFNLFEFVSGVGVFEHGGGGSMFTVDSKAMRKVGAQDDIAITIEDRLFGFEVAMEGRMLIKLH